MRTILRTMGTPAVLLDDGLVLPEAAVQAAVRRAFEQLAAGRAVQPQQVVTDLPDGGDVIASRPVFFRSVGLGIEDAAVALAALQAAGMAS
jgi:hypothetical protein